ncbi:MAG: UvrD-helicase domain-containing protein, partial [Flavobacteriales bacterium]|nr:UvrD-helicase domain-containing protein [Flavobacteriales bacterium]
MSKQITIAALFGLNDFKPNASQFAAIEHADGPLFLTAGPGSGKTRVLLWRTVNLIVCKGVAPERIFLSTFTEKAAHQLKEGLRYLLSLATTKTGQHYDISGMAIGTVHSICRKILADRRLHGPTERPKPVVLMDALSQYFQVSRKGWPQLVNGFGFDDPQEAQRFLTRVVDGFDNGSKHLGVLTAIKAFNRFSEESILPHVELKCDEDWQRMRDGYKTYLDWLNADEVRRVDLSLLQQEALAVLLRFPGSEHLYEHVIVDEYQDTNSIQEALFFHLASGHKNLVVVGDDDQALYRFRGATVENL